VSSEVRILLVDDDPQFRRLLQLVLRRVEDFACVGEAAEGKAGVEQAERLRPDVVLLDLMMPGMDGFEALPRIREVHPEAAVIILTALDPDEAAKGILHGATAFVEKRDIVDRLEPTIRAAVPAQRDPGEDVRG
jgi:DNA-binding NarL/FixJ family response regulator